MHAEGKDPARYLFAACETPVRGPKIRVARPPPPPELGRLGLGEGKTDRDVRWLLRVKTKKDRAPCD